MATIENDCLNEMASAFNDFISTGSGTACLQFETAGDSVLAVCDIVDDPVFQVAPLVAGSLYATPTDDTSATAGTVAKVSLYTCTGSKAIEFTCGVDSGDFRLTSLNIGAGDTVRVTEFTFAIQGS